MERVVVCMRWGALYPAVYVNVLYSAVKKHMSEPFRFVCFTSDDTGLAKGIETFPIPDLGYSDRHWAKGAWPKLSVFVEDLQGLSGRALFIDLDSVVLGNLEPFFHAPGDLVSIAGGAEWRRGSDNPNPSLASGVFCFDIGAQPQVAERFCKDPEAAFDEFKIEQRFLQAHVSEWKTWEKEWVISYKKHLRQPMFLDRIKPARLPGPNTKIVAFHGDPRPIDVIRPDRSSYESFPRFGRGAIPWVRDYWLEHGYTDP